MTAEGRRASNKASFNREILSVIETYILDGALSYGELDGIVKELLDDMIPPTPIRIRERAGMKGRVLNLTPATRVALQVLPSTGAFLKGAADAIYPSELGG